MKVSRTVAHRSAHPNSLSLIQTLPSELLLIIFKYAHVVACARGKATDSAFSCPEDACVAEQRCFCYVRSSGGCGEYCDDNELPLLARFPNSVASVCSRWGELMLLVPAFWTRIIVFLDAEIFSPEDLRNQLRALGERPFEVIVSRTSFSDVVGLKDVERSHMTQIITILRPHFHWCRSLRIEVIHSSSLPRLLAILPSDMPHLRKLSLDSRIDSGQPEVLRHSLFRATPLHGYNVDSIVIDGWNLFDLCDHYSTPEDNSLLRGCYALSVKFGEVSEPSILALTKICPLQNLNIDSVTITPGITPANNNVNIPWGIPICFATLITITLKNLGAESMEMVLQYVHEPLRIAIDNCRFRPTPSTLKPGSQSLQLRNIGCGQGLENFMRVWCGSNLIVTRCPGFNDNVLNVMRSLRSGYNLLQPNQMEGLHIQDCHDLSEDALKKFVAEKGSNSRRGRSRRSTHWVG